MKNLSAPLYPIRISLLRLLLTALLATGTGSAHGAQESPHAKAVNEASAATTVPKPSALSSPGQSRTPLADGTTLLAGGVIEGQPSNGLWLQPATTTAGTPTPSKLPFTLATPRIRHTATQLPDGRILVWGGVDARGAVRADGELIDLEARRATPLSTPLLAPRSGHTVTMLENGDLLLAGGVDTKEQPALALERFDPRHGTVETLGRATQARVGGIATYLPGGRVLFSGGIDERGTPVDGDELYDPVTATVRVLPPAEVRALRSGLEQGRAALRSTLPAAEATDAAYDAPITLAFNRAMAQATLNSATMTLVGPRGALAQRVVAAEQGTLAFLTPVDGLLPGTSYSVFVRGAKDSAGRELPLQAFAFTTRIQTTGNDIATDKRAARSRIWTPHGRKRADGSAVPGWTYDTNLAGSHKDHLRRQEAHRKRMEAEALSAPAGVTALSGVVKMLDGTPLPNVQMELADRSVRSDRQGRFLIADVPAGVHTLVIDGSVATTDGMRFGVYLRHIELKAGETLKLDDAVWMPALDPRGTVRIGAPLARDVILTHPDLPGLEVKLPAGSLLRDRHSRPVTEVNITPVPTDRAPFPMPDQAEFPVYFTLQPGGARLVTPAGPPKTVEIVYPNAIATLPGTEQRFWHYDPVEKGWMPYGTGKVSADGSQVKAESGTGITQFTGFSVSVAPQSGRPGNTCSGGDGAQTTSSGDPVALCFGAMEHAETDLFANDVVPVALTRTHMAIDAGGKRFAFGYGFTHSFETALTYSVGSAIPERMMLTVPDGTQYPFVRANAGVSYANATWEHTDSRGPYYKARIIYDATAGLFLLTQRDGSQMGFHKVGGHLQWLRDRNGNQTTVVRDPAVYGRIIRVESHNGRWIEFDYYTSGSPNGLISATRDNAGHTVSYTYNATSRLETVTLPDNRQWRYEYDASGRLLRIRAPWNDATEWMVTNEYTTLSSGGVSRGFITRQTYADASTASIAYTPVLVDGFLRSAQTDFTDERGTVRRVTFSPHGYVSENTFAYGTPLAQTTTFELDEASGRVKAEVDALARRTEYTYDIQGNVTRVTRLAGTAQAVSESFTWNADFSTLASRTDALGRTTGYGYDAQGNLIQITGPAPLNLVTQFSYDGQGRVLSTQQGSGPVTSFAYDGPDLASVTDGAGHVTNINTDALGRTTQLRDAVGNATEYGYDAGGHLTLVQDPLGGQVRFEFDARGRLSGHRDENGNLTGYGYDARHRLNLRRDALNRSDSHSYLPDGLVQSTTDRAGKVTARSYDALGRLARLGFGATPGSPTAFTRVLDLQYDAANRPTSFAEKTCAGLDCATVLSTTTVTRSYDGLDRLTMEAGPTGTVSYTHDAAGRLLSVTAAGQPAVTYGWDAADRLTAVSWAAGALNGNAAQTVSYTWDGASRLTRKTFPHGSTADYAYDDAGRLLSITYKTSAGNLLGDVSYAYDAAGRRTQVGGSLNEPLLPQATTADEVHNALNQTTAFDGASLTYDNLGNLTGDGTHTYVWDERGRLTEIRQGAATVARFAYDPLNRRYLKEAGTTVTRVLHDGWNPLLEQDGAGSPTAFLLNGLGLDERHARFTANQKQFFLTDALGSTLRLVDQNNATLAAYRYDLYGRTTQTGASDNPYQYTGRENDATGLYYYRNRYYSPRLARFVSEDPIGIEGGINLYAYVGGNPVSLADPLGLEGQISLGIGGNLGFQFPGVFNGNGAFVGGGLSIGATSCGTIFVSANYSYGQGIGAYAGVGANVSVGATPSSTPPGLSTSRALQFDANAGAGPSAGGSISVSPNSLGAGTGIGGARLGAGYGAAVSASVVNSSTYNSGKLFTPPSWVSKWLPCGCD